MKVHVAAKNYKDETEIINDKEYAKFDIVCRIFDYHNTIRLDFIFRMAFADMQEYMSTYYSNNTAYVGFEIYEIRLLDF